MDEKSNDTKRKTVRMVEKGVLKLTKAPMERVKTTQGPRKLIMNDESFYEMGKANFMIKEITEKEKQEMSNLWGNPLFGLALSIFAYLVGMLIFRRFPHPLTTPLLLATIFVIVFLKLTNMVARSKGVVKGCGNLRKINIPTR